MHSYCDQWQNTQFSFKYFEQCILNMFKGSHVEILNCEVFSVNEACFYINSVDIDKMIQRVPLLHVFA